MRFQQGRVDVKQVKQPRNVALSAARPVVVCVVACAVEEKSEVQILFTRRRCGKTGIEAGELAKSFLLRKLERLGRALWRKLDDGHGLCRLAELAVWD